MSGFRVELGVEHYRIIAPDGTEGPLACFGETPDDAEVATIRYGGDIYFCLVTDPDTDPADILVERVSESISTAPEVDEACAFPECPLCGGELETVEDEGGDDEPGEEGEESEEEEEETPAS